MFSSCLLYTSPTIAQENGTQGRVTCQFVVGADGRVRDVNVLRGVDPVSYTHLDVYKRQALHAGGQRFESVILHS